MKKLIKLFGMAVIVAAIVFSFAACGDSNDTSGGGGLTITTASLPDGMMGRAYNQTLAARGDAPITWSIEEGSLPTGLGLSTAGAITGTPTAANTFTFTVKATNAEEYNTKEFIIIINPPTPIASDYTFGNRNQDVGTTITAVTITARSNRSEGGITIYYEGIGGTNYPKSTNVPQEGGRYAVTFDVAAHGDWAGATGLSAGTLAVFPGTITVTSGASSGAGTLRQAILDIPDGGRIVIDPSVRLIELTSRLPGNSSATVTYINKSMAIEGNGVTITKAASMQTDGDTQLIHINGTAVNPLEVTIRSVHFKNGRATDYGAAIRNQSYSTLTLESCIFSGNRATGTSPLGQGGALHNGANSTLNVKGCTFYNNSTASVGGAIFNVSNGTLNLTGNLFYGNTASNNGPVVRYAGTADTVVSHGYNVSDVAFGTGTSQTGFAAKASDRTTAANAIPFSPLTFRPLYGNVAANAIASLPSDYPDRDFYDDPITDGASAGAVQGVTASGIYLGLSVNNDDFGSVAAVPAPSADGIVSPGSVTITATAATGYRLKEWTVDGTGAGDTNPFIRTLTAHTVVQAVFDRVVLVDNFSDAAGSQNSEGTLRYALTNATEGDIILLDDADGATVIELRERLPEITTSVTILGNGVTLTRGAAWTGAASATSQLMYINGTGTDVTISRLWFKDGRATDFGAAIRISIANRTGNDPKPGTVNLESCIFSGNQGSLYSNEGGNIYKTGTGTLNVKSSTFYNNSSVDRGGAIYIINGDLNLTGNLFYWNTATRGPVVFRNGGTVRSGGYNVADVPFGTGSDQTGFDSATGDKTINTLPVSSGSLKLLSGNQAANVITTLPAGYPSSDFYGTAITAGAAAGAVQSALPASGNILLLSVNYSSMGSVSASPAPDAEGFVSSNSVTITATPTGTNTFKHWMVNGNIHATTTSPLSLTLTGHTKVQAVFTRVVNVTVFTNTGTGTLRNAINSAQDGDTIRLVGVTPGETVIELASPRLGGSDGIRNSITIEGNGVILTRAESWTATGNDTQLMYLNGGSSTISGVWFKDGKATDYGAAIRVGRGALTLESCIFSGNQTATGATAQGGAISTEGTLNLRGCTFYNNRTTGGGIYGGGAVFVANNGALTLSGNLFFGNSAAANAGLAVRVNAKSATNNGGNATSKGYNVVDMALGEGGANSGFAGVTGDTTIAALLGNNGTTPFANAATLAPKNQLSIIPSTFAANMPATDFLGIARTWPGVVGAVR